MITISLPTPTPKAVWKKISQIIRENKKYIGYIETRELLINYIELLEQDYHIDSDYLWRYYVVPQI